MPLTSEQIEEMKKLLSKIPVSGSFESRDISREIDQILKSDGRNATAYGAGIEYKSQKATEPNQAPEPTTLAVTPRAPSSTSRAS